MSSPPSESVMGAAEHATAKGSWKNLGTTAYNTAFGALSTVADVLCTYPEHGTRTGTVPATDTSIGKFVYPAGDDVLQGQVVDALFYGTSASNQTFSAQVWLWHTLRQNSGTQPDETVLEQWFPLCLYTTMTITLSARTGVAGGIISDTQFYADIIGTPTADRSGNPLGYQTSQAPGGAGDDAIGTLNNIDVGKAKKIMFLLTRSGGSAATCGVACCAKGG